MISKVPSSPVTLSPSLLHSVSEPLPCGSFACCYQLRGGLEDKYKPATLFAPNKRMVKKKKNQRKKLRLPDSACDLPEDTGRREPRSP
jgi:hypothetical protein